MKLNKWDYLFLAFCFITYFVWANVEPSSVCPDEVMRYDVPRFIFENGRLPDGYELINVEYCLYGFSYAFYPFFLGPLVSAFFMKLMSFFTLNPHWLLMAARLTSMLSGVLIVYFTMKIGKKCFHKRIQWLMVVIVGMLPQFVFLSSYVNNDIIALLGAAILLYAWILGVEEWNRKSCGLLILGIIICTLSYYNAYGWILCSILVFFISYGRQLGKNQGCADMFKKTGIISVVVLAVISYFFIRNAILYQGDFLGLKTLAACSEEFAVDYLKPSVRNTPYNLGLSLWQMLFGHDYMPINWIHSSARSFIGVLGYMDRLMANTHYILYGLIFLSGVLGWVASAMKQQRTPAQKWLDAFVVIGCMIPILLSIYYSYMVDFQPQGRYFEGILVGLIFLCGQGWNRFLDLVEAKFGEKYATIISTAVCVYAIVTMIDTYLYVLTPGLI